MTKKTQGYMALRRQAQGGRPLVRRGGGKWLAFGIDWCCEESGLSKGALIAELSRSMDMTRDQIYRVTRGHVGMPPDVLWRAGRVLRELGVWWMSGPLALALEPRYDAHLIGVVGELVLEPMHFLWRGSLYDFLRYRAEFREQSEFGLRCIKAGGTLYSPLLDLFEAAWQRWYAFEASELGTKEHETHFADSAPALARAVSLLRAQQRDADTDPNEPSYRVLLHDINKDIREYFGVGGHQQPPRYARKRYHVEVAPRFNLLSNDAFGQTDFGQKLQRLITPGGDRVSPSEAYRRGWDLSVPGSSGLLALALLDYEREYYLLIARVIAHGISRDHKPLLPILQRQRESRQSTDDTDVLRRYKTWWKALWAISCLIGPSDETLYFRSEELADNLDATLAGSRQSIVSLKVSDLHKALFLESNLATELCRMVTLPDDIADELSNFSISSTYDPSDYDSSVTPAALATVLDMLHQPEFGYPPDETRTELFWWFRDVAHLLDEVN